MALSLSGGPSQVEVAQPRGSAFKSTSWLTNDSLRYRSRVLDLTASFLQYISPGSGVTHGAQTDWLRLTASRRVFGKLHGSLDTGLAYNQSVIRRSGQGQVQVETWEVGAHLSREFREHASIYATYQFQRQVASTQVCFANQCGRTYVRNILGAGINWHGRPVRIR